MGRSAAGHWTTQTFSSVVGQLQQLGILRSSGEERSAVHRWHWNSTKAAQETQLAAGASTVYLSFPAYLHGNMNEWAAVLLGLEEMCPTNPISHRHWLPGSVLRKCRASSPSTHIHTIQTLFPSCLHLGVAPGSLACAWFTLGRWLG